MHAVSKTAAHVFNTMKKMQLQTGTSTLAADYPTLMAACGLGRRKTVADAVSELLGAGWVTQEKQQHAPALYSLIATGAAQPQPEPDAVLDTASAASCVEEKFVELSGNFQPSKFPKFPQSSLKVPEVPVQQSVPVQVQNISTAMQCNAARNFENFGNFEETRTRMVALFSEFGIDAPLRNDLAAKVCERYRDDLERAFNDVVKCLEHQRAREKSRLVRRAVGVSIKIIRGYAAGEQMQLFPIEPPKPANTNPPTARPRTGKGYRLEQVSYTDETRAAARARAAQRIAQRAAQKTGETHALVS